MLEHLLPIFGKLSFYYHSLYTNSLEMVLFPSTPTPDPYEKCWHTVDIYILAEFLQQSILKLQYPPWKMSVNYIKLA